MKKWIAALLSVMILAGGSVAALAEEGATATPSPEASAEATQAPTKTPEATKTPDAAKTPEATQAPTAQPDAQESAAPTLAPNADLQARVTVGKDLSKAQKAKVYEYFGIAQGSVPELTVTIDEEKSYLGGLVPAEKIGSRSLSSVYLKVREAGAGISVQTYNINWVTSEMYIAALGTAGIPDADILVAAPTNVSGTAALTGLFKAYEDITGKKLNDSAKNVATEELVTTGELADVLGSKEATALINELKTILNEIKGKSPDEVREIVKRVANELNIELTADQLEQVVQLVIKISQLDIDPEQLLKSAQNLQSTLDKLSKAQDSVGGFFQKVSTAWNNVIDWFKKLFGIK
ncbi:MAG: DUF1002 domain-containing protein [Eubacteriales bacterium]|nr:DUF1002 domain-containing protein [Eubacteriales bacterium]